MKNIVKNITVAILVLFAILVTIQIASAHGPYEKEYDVEYLFNILRKLGLQPQVAKSVLKTLPLNEVEEALAMKSVHQGSIAKLVAMAGKINRN